MIMIFDDFLEALVRFSRIIIIIIIIIIAVLFFSGVKGQTMVQIKKNLSLMLHISGAIHHIIVFCADEE